MKKLLLLISTTIVLIAIITYVAIILSNREAVFFKCKVNHVTLVPSHEVFVSGYYKKPYNLSDHSSKLQHELDTKQSKAEEILDNLDSYYYFSVECSLKNSGLANIDYVNIYHDSTNQYLLHSIDSDFLIGPISIKRLQKIDLPMLVIVSKDVGSTEDAMYLVKSMNPKIEYKYNARNNEERMKEIKMDFTDAKVVLN